MPLSENAEIVEWFTPRADGSRLDYRIRVTDSATLTEPIVMERHWLWLPDVEVQPFEGVN